MTEDEKNQQRYALVVKSNDLIRKSRFSLSLVEQRVVLYLISKIKPTDIAPLEYDLNIQEFCEICGIDYSSNLTQLKAAIKALSDKSCWATLPDGSETLLRWIEKQYVYKDSGIITVRLDKDMMPYLMQLKRNFTQYELIAILALKSKCSIRLYELLKSYEFVGVYKASLQDLRRAMALEGEYKETKDFKRYVIDRALDEITTYTDLDVSYALVKQGRSIVGFEFSIRRADGFDGEYRAAQRFLSGERSTRHAAEKRAKEAIAGGVKDV